MTGPGLLCTSAPGLDWTLGQKLLHGPEGPGPGSPPPSCLSEGPWFCLPGFKSLFPPQCPFGLCEETRNRLEGSGASAFCKGSWMSLCAHCWPLSPSVACSSCAGSEGQQGTLLFPKRPPLAFPHGRAFSEAGSHVSPNPQLEVGDLQIPGSQP